MSLSVHELSQCLPASLKGQATQSLADKINQLVADPDVAKQISDNFVTLSSVLREGRYKLEDYMNAVQYVSFKLMGMSNLESYKLTFPQRHQRLVAKGASDKDISAYVAGYNKGKLVSSLLEQAAIPAWLLNQGVFQDAINHQAFLMKNAQSEKVQSDAANSLIVALKQPDKKEVSVNLGVTESDGMREMKEMMLAMAQTQKDLIAQGVPTKRIAHQGLNGMIDITPIEEAEKVER